MDTRTAEVRVEDFVAVQEVGKVINPVLAAGQIEGGVAQGIGFALYENVVWQEGRMVNGQMTNYMMPTSMDLPPIRVFFEEIPYERGPAGAKGIGELPLDGTAPAIANAIAHATGADIRQIPITPEVLLEMLPRCRDERPKDTGRRACLMRRAKLPFTCEVNGERVTFEAYPMARLLDVLREQLKLTGTKEGCGEGECGACAVEMDGALVNSCLVPALQAQGAKIRTIEGVADSGAGTLHAVQQAFLTYGGAQCGICTPGMILAAVNLLARNPQPDDAQIREGLSGNLCRCTGYMKIFESVVEAMRHSSARITNEDPRVRAFLPGYHMETPRDLAAALDAHGEGARRLEAVRRRHGFDGVARSGKAAAQKVSEHLEFAGIARNRQRAPIISTLGALTTYTEVRRHEILVREFPLLCRAAAETGSIATQNRGTLGGNIANASPAADSPPALLVYDAEIEIVSASGQRWIPYRRFHSGYKQMDLQPSELIRQIRLPRNKHAWKQYFRKVGTRRAQAISKVCFAAAARVEAGKLADVRIVLGSVAPTVIARDAHRGSAARPEAGCRNHKSRAGRARSRNRAD